MKNHCFTLIFIPFEHPELGMVIVTTFLTIAQLETIRVYDGLAEKFPEEFRPLPEILNENPIKTFSLKLDWIADQMRNDGRFVFGIYSGNVGAPSSRVLLPESSPDPFEVIKTFWTVYNGSENFAPSKIQKQES